MIIAIRKENENIVDKLLKSGANTEAKDMSGNTPLIIAIKNKNENITNMLIDAGADVNVQDNHRNSVLMLAVLQQNESLVARLLPPKPNKFLSFFSIISKKYRIFVVQNYYQTKENGLYNQDKRGSW